MKRQYFKRLTYQTKDKKQIKQIFINPKNKTMKKLMILSVAALAFTACSNEDLVDNSVGNGGKDGPIGFFMQRSNMTRASKDLQDTKHYNFGVFAYKSTETVNNIMANYLVGYNGDNVGYYMTSANQTTLGDAAGQVDGQSKWQYEKLGNKEYTYAGEGFYRAEQKEYMSNVEEQYLRYWDLSAPTTAFYAYAPYMNLDKKGATVSYVDGTAQSATGNDTYVMTFPNGSIVTAKNNPDLNEYMYATTKVAKDNYGHDVSLQFKRLNAKVNIKFWEDIPGYSVRILDLKEGTYSGVQATPAIHKDNDVAGTHTYKPYGYRLGQYYLSNGAKIQFPAETIYQFEGQLATTGTSTTPLEFAAPTASAIGETRLTASASDDTYYVVPKNGTSVLLNTAKETSETGTVNEDLKKTGFTFHVSYELTSTTGERIVVKDATVFVPADYCDWKNNTHYTYIFKITKNSNGSTDPDNDNTIDPTTDPEVPTELGLYPIVFDNCTITDYEEVETEHVITDGTSLTYYDVQLSTYSLVSGDIDVTVSTNHADAAHPAIDYANVKVYKGAVENPTGVTYASGTKKITVTAAAAPGVYDVVYTCHTTGDFDHPQTWTEHFVVGSVFAVSTNLTKVGTHGLADTKLDITATQDGNTVTPTAAQLYIEYPSNISNPEKNLVKVSDDRTKVEISKTAKPGTYKLVYTVDEGKKVKVAEQVFTVVDYQHTLSSKVVYLNDGASLTVNKKGTDDAVTLDDAVVTAGKITISGTTINVANDCPEGVYNVYYTVNRTDATSIVRYIESFEVRNSHSVALSATSMDRSTGTHAPGDYSTDTKTITTMQNGVVTTTDLHTSLSIVKADGTVTATGDFKITYVSGNSYTLEVKNTVPAGNYRVKFVSTVKGADKAEYFDFVVTE